MKIKGLITAPFTAFNKSGELNIPMVDKQASVYKKNHLGGAFICGTTGESSALTMTEKKRLYKAWSKHKSHDFKIIAFLGGTCIQECRELALYAQECELDAVALTAPYYFKAANVKALAGFCREVASAVPEMPFYYYHIPSFTGAYFSMYELLQEIDVLIPNFAGVKFTYENMMDYQLCLNFQGGKYDILWGRDEMLLEALAIGAEGAVGSTYGYSAPIYMNIILSFRENNLEEARKHQPKALEFISLLNKYGGGTGKAFMKAMGLDVGLHRPPVTNLTRKQLKEFQADLEKLDFKAYCCKI
ncbi:MAG: dihydrodipicolinate synthase family protein [Tannerella sp.]|jgi:N-acetylneuraminate lyase|nr:dihydrodipicolinate synthase family protein [Tannerella sp.]